jgi:uncharacterized surface protein with fasciclin (FAS1) repeats
MNKNLLTTSLRKLALSAVLALSVIGLRAQSVYDFIAASPNHTSLTAAIDAAGLAATLSGPGEFTVFAPTDAAFDAALAELGVTLGDLAADVPALTDILLYHVVDGTVLSSELMNGMTPTPLNAANTIKVTVGGSGVFVNQAQVTGPDNTLFEGDAITNGVVHVTDAVILATETVVDVALSTGVHTSLVAAVIAAELLPALTNPFAELTVFAPTDDAFTAALTELGVTLGDLAADIPALQAILTYHVVDGTVLSSDLTNGAVPTLSGEEVIVNIDMGTMINSSNVTGADNETGNGVVHVIDAVLFATYLGVEENDLGGYAVTVYPNPSSDFVTVDTNGTDFNSVIIQDYTGRVVFDQTVSANTTTIDVHELASGQYIITLVGNNNKISEKLLIGSNR